MTVMALWTATVTSEANEAPVRLLGQRARNLIGPASTSLHDADPETNLRTGAPSYPRFRWAATECELEIREPTRTVRPLVASADAEVATRASGGRRPLPVPSVVTL